MTMTEEQAREKWCPFARVILHLGHDIYTPAAFNRNVDEACKLEGRADCIASDCMAWRGKLVKCTRYYDEKGNLAVSGRAYEPGELEGREYVEMCGHCGLAGAPQ